jgi:hypothetical protein
MPGMRLNVKMKSPAKSTGLFCFRFGGVRDYFFASATPIFSEM